MSNSNDDAEKKSFLDKVKDTWKTPVGKTWLSLGTLCILLFVGALVLEGILHILFGINIGGHLKRAADANQPTMVIEELEIAIAGMEKEDYCNDPSAGDQYTSSVYQTPDDDVCFWRENINSTLADLKALPEDASHLEVSNTLMKVRESLLDKDGGLEVTHPPGIAWYPYNRLLDFLEVLSSIAALLLWFGAEWFEKAFKTVFPPKPPEETTEGPKEDPEETASS